MRRFVPLAACALLAAACSTTQRWQLGIPGSHFDLTVTRVEQRGELLDVWLQGGDLALRSFAPASPACARVLRPEEFVTWNQGGSGTFRAGDLRCQAAGIGSLEEWRDRGRATPDLRESPVPSAQANYRIVYEDAEVAFLRGRFPLATRLGWASLGDTIAVVPKQDVCAEVLERRVATLEYFARGSPVLALMGREAPCPIVGLVRPPVTELTRTDTARDPVDRPRGPDPELVAPPPARPRSDAVLGG